uniref:Uncharacterized protein n=1 Tax=Serinus canaria TaxID=9135 RepID=A0A8C9KV82_SERCA
MHLSFGFSSTTFPVSSKERESQNIFYKEEGPLLTLGEEATEQELADACCTVYTSIHPPSYPSCGVPALFLQTGSSNTPRATRAYQPMNQDH